MGSVSFGVIGDPLLSLTSVADVNEFLDLICRPAFSRIVKVNMEIRRGNTWTEKRRVEDWQQDWIPGICEIRCRNLQCGGTLKKADCFKK